MIIETLRFGNDVELNSLEDVVKELKKNGYEEEKRITEWIKKS